MKLKEILKEAKVNPVFKYWNDAFEAMYASSVVGLTVDRVQGNDLRMDYTVFISGQVKAENMSGDEEEIGNEQYDSFTGTIVQHGKTLHIKFGTHDDPTLYDEDMSHLLGEDAEEVGETFTHALDDRFF